MRPDKGVDTAKGKAVDEEARVLASTVADGSIRVDGESTLAYHACSETSVAR